jgi:hypothetical protein
MEERVKSGFERSTVKPMIVSSSFNGLTGEQTSEVMSVRQWRSIDEIFLALTRLTDDQAVPPMMTTSTPVTSLLCLALRLLSLPFCA